MIFSVWSELVAKSCTFCKIILKRELISKSVIPTLSKVEAK